MAVTPQDIALACEAINRAPGLSPLARRVGIELVNHVDRNTGTAWPSEARLADALGVDPRSIRRAKAQLKAHGFLTWEQRGRHHQRTPLYQIAWNLLRNIAKGIKDRLKAAAKPFQRKAQAQPRQQEIGLGRTFRAAYLTQVKNIVLDGARKAVQRTSLPSQADPTLLDKRAHSRLYEALGKYPEQTFASILAAMSPDMEQQAIKAERFRQGTGLETLLGLLKGSTGATSHNPSMAAPGGTL